LLAQVVGEVLGEGAQSLTESDVPNLQAHEQAEARYEAQFENWVASKGWVIQPAPGERNRCSQYALNMAARAAHRRPIDDEALRDEVDAQRMEFELDWAGDELPADGMLALDADQGGHGPALVRALNRQFGVGAGEGFVVEMYRPITAVSMGPDDGFVPVYLDAEGSVDAAAVEGIDPQRLIRVVQRGQHYDAILPHESLSVSLEGNEPAKGLRPGKRKRGKPIVADVADSNELICRFCSKKYKTPYGLHQHEWNHHGAPLPEKSALTRTSEKKHVCDFCQKQFSTGGDLKKHRRTHTGEKPYDCEFCPKRFADKSNLNKHIRIHTDEKPYGCDFCAEQFAAIDHLKRHMPTHTGIKSHICDFCQKQFVSGGDLKQHMRTHTGEKPFVCGVCQMGFSTSGNLTVHRRKHTGEKPFGCDFCSRRFANSSSRARHVRIHTDERPFVCEMCRKGFFTTGKLKVHMRTHANGKTPRE
ncbi:C2H2-type zinc finger protein, partial [Burkholderia cenocepacia]|uniref:C2H2-type zinc finger protein n=1 Tax=Burkholderia cenocepacia TaxID=95486 RepID=UPI001623CC82